MSAKEVPTIFNRRSVIPLLDTTSMVWFVPLFLFILVVFHHSFYQPRPQPQHQFWTWPLFPKCQFNLDLDVIIDLDLNIPNDGVWYHKVSHHPVNLDSDNQRSSKLVNLPRISLSLTIPEGVVGGVGSCFSGRHDRNFYISAISFWSLKIEKIRGGVHRIESAIKQNILENLNLVIFNENS